MIDCQLQRQITNFAIRRYTPPYVAPCSANVRCGIRDANSLYWNQLPASFRARNRDYFVRPCSSFPPCCGGPSRRCCC